jgi:hypothetical protein
MKKSITRAREPDPEILKLARLILAACISYRRGIGADYALTHLVPRKQVPQFWINLAKTIDSAGWRSLNTLLANRRIPARNHEAKA